MGEVYYLISDAAKQVQVETHVLRYWEEELHLPIQRNKQGHRFYTAEDVNRFKQIKTMKEKGYQLKAIRSALAEKNIGKTEEMNSGNTQDREIKNKETQNKGVQHMLSETKENTTYLVNAQGDYSIEPAIEEARESKSIRLQILLKHMISEAVSENNEQLCENVKETVLKELDYQFRLQEEREEEREKERRQREEEHYKKLDEIIREKSSKGKRKKHSIF